MAKRKWRNDENAEAESWALVEWGTFREGLLAHKEGGRYTYLHPRRDRKQIAAATCLS